MADNGNTQGAEIQQHEKSWNGFKAMMLWGTVIAFLVGAGVVLLIAQK